MLFTLQRYEIFSKSQQRVRKSGDFRDVVYLAKVRNFQQITTSACNIDSVCQMLFTLQRYEIFSKSQRPSRGVTEYDRCCLPCKGTKFLANHNRQYLCLSQMQDVVYLAKVRNFQQITTCVLASVYYYRCCLPCKGTKFLANHNTQVFCSKDLNDVVYLAKVRNFQQITTLVAIFCVIS